MNNDRLFEQARAVPILEVAAVLGIEVNHHGKARCLVHRDSDPSMSLNSPGNRFKCFSCQAGGSPVDLVKQAEGLDDLGAAEWIRDRFFPDPGTRPKPSQNHPKAERPAESKPKAAPAPPGHYSDIYNALIDLGRDVDTMPDAARDYLVEKRGLSRDILRTWRVRYYSENQRRAILHNMQERFPENEEALRGAGILAKSDRTGGDYYGFFQCPYIFPFLGMAGRVLYVQGRISPKEKGKGNKYINPKSPPAGIPAAQRPILYGAHVLDGLPDGATVHLVEGVPDTLTVNDQGRPAVGIPGVGMFSERTARYYIEALRRFNVVFSRHNDPPGQDGISPGQELERDVVRFLRGQVAGLSLARIPDGTKDLNDYLMEIRKHGRE